MSDLQDLIHKTSMDCLERGKLLEKERIIKLLEDPVTMSNWWATPDKSLGLYGNLKNYVIELIKEETNG